MNSIGRRAFNRALLGALAAPALACGRGATQASPHAAIFMLDAAADRQEQLLEGAKREGVVVLYTSLNTQDSGPLTAAFEKKYGIPTQIWRAASERVLQRAVSEAGAGRVDFDVIETNAPEMEAMYRERVLDEFRSPMFAELAPASFPPHGHYVATRFNFFTIGYNTELVTPDEVPHSYEDLLHPRFAGRIGMEAGDVDWFGAMVKHMGEPQGLAYFRKLASLKPLMRTGHTLVGQLVASGEIPLAPNIYNHNAERLLVQGAPIRWKAIAPTFGRANSVGVVRRAPHPHAAMLFTDFILSTEGQTILKTRNRVPSSRAVESHLNDFPFMTIDPVITLDEDEKWSKLWSDLFLRGGRIVRDS